VRRDPPDNDLVSQSNEVLERERQSLLRRVHELRQRAVVHREVLQHLEQQLAHEERLLREIEELSDHSAQLRLERLDRQLRGRRLQEIAVAVLRQRIGRDQAIHYRDWFALLRAEGYEISGRDPVNSFLTGIGRAPGVERLGSRTGLYRITV
jgi:hypothetical protein